MLRLAYVLYEPDAPVGAPVKVLCMGLLVYLDGGETSRVMNSVNLSSTRGDLVIIFGIRVALFYFKPC